MNLPTIPAFDLPTLGWVGKAGHDNGDFDVALIEPINKNIRHYLPHKPWGGLWTSPVIRDDAGTVVGTDWTQWCHAENFWLHGVARVVTIIEPDPTAPIYVIENVEDLVALEEEYPWRNHPTAYLWVDPQHARYRPWPYVDWDALALDVAGVYLTEGGQWRTRFSSPGLNGWDCATVLWLQPQVTRGELIELPARTEVESND